MSGRNKIRSMKLLKSIAIMITHVPLYFISHAVTTSCNFQNEFNGP
jgi:hypothetical protein